MIISFDTEYGKIECNHETGLAYFQADDYECPIKNGTFHDVWKRRFDIIWPSSFNQEWKEAILSVWQPCEIGRALPS